MKAKNNLPYAELKREYYKKQTNGIFTLFDAAFEVHSLERPNLDNKSNISCIPEGLYFCKPDNVGKHKWFTVEDVPNRSNIEIHGANLVKDLRGCIGLGLNAMDIDGDGIDDIQNCKPVLEELKRLCPNGFWLKIYS